MSLLKVVFIYSFESVLFFAPLLQLSILQIVLCTQGNQCVHSKNSPGQCSFEGFERTIPALSPNLWSIRPHFPKDVFLLFLVVRMEHKLLRIAMLTSMPATFAILILPGSPAAPRTIKTVEIVWAREYRPFR